MAVNVENSLYEERRMHCWGRRVPRVDLKLYGEKKLG